MKVGSEGRCAKALFVLRTTGAALFLAIVL